MPRQMLSSGVPARVISGRTSREAELVEAAHRLAEGADAGQHQLVGLARRLWRVDHRAGGAQMFERVEHRAQVAHAIADDPDQARAASRREDPGCPGL